jgi:hypothetical protein
VLQRARTTPDLLLLATVSVILAGLICAGLGFHGFRGRADALDRARAETVHQASLQIVRTKTVIADTAAADDVLRGKTRRPIAERQFDFALEPAVTGLVVAARHADASRLALANRWLARYAQQVDNARTLARAGDARAAADSLQKASALLRAEVLPPLVAAQQASQARLANDQSAATWDALIGILGALLALLVLGGVHWWLTLHTRRLVNLGLAAGLIVLLVVGLSGLVTVSVSRHRATVVEDGAHLVARQLVDARVAAFDARGRESLSVISDNVLTEDAQWKQAMSTARAALAGAEPGATAIVHGDLANITGLLKDYQTQHARLLDRARVGDDAGVRMRVAGANYSAGAFEEFDAFSGALLARQVQASDDGWTEAGHNLRPVAWLSLLAGLVAAGLGWLGLSARSREYR